MPRITAKDLDKISEKVKKIIQLREGSGKAKILVHMGTCGIAAGARKVMSALMDEIEKKNMKNVILTTSSCAGLCSREPMMTVEIKGEPPVKYVDLNEENVKEILRTHIIEGKIAKKYALSMGSERVL